jgi:hypothetical protein
MSSVREQPVPTEGAEGDLREGGYIDEMVPSPKPPFEQIVRRRYGDWVKFNGKWVWRNRK